MRQRIDPPICVALDVGDLAAAGGILDALSSRVRVFKVGLELFTAEGPRAVEEVRARGAEVFLDLKINDIPNQAAGAVRAARAMGVGYLTVHGNAGRATVFAAVDAATDGLPRILVVSVLTSLDEAALRELGVGRSLSDQVVAMADLASAAGAPGLVLSADEVAQVRGRHEDLLLVTPGIRPASTDANDQKRVATPAAAVRAGADLLVLGRAVTGAGDPVAAVEAVIDEIAEARPAVSSTGA